MIGIIGGSGLYALTALSGESRTSVTTDFGEPSAPVVTGKLADVDIAFLPRHGEDHHLPPHLVNYRANISALKNVGVKTILATTAVGGIASDAGPGVLVIPDQIIDYTYGREHTFFDGRQSGPSHVDITEPYTAAVRQALISACQSSKATFVAGGTYAATQGPRLETAAEIDRLERDGCSIVGMTGMPEAGLAREAEIDYGNISLVVNWGAGRAGGPITEANIADELQKGMERIAKVLAAAIATLAA
ncbi:MAG: S-methyl-5'-thioinosine phosphorylase [Pseudomonadota bacterium]